MSKKHWCELSNEALQECFWQYQNDEMNVHEKQSFQQALSEYPDLEKQYQDFLKKMALFSQWEDQNPPLWRPESLFPKRPGNFNWSLVPTVLASLALVFSLMPYIHSDNNGIHFQFSKNYLTKTEFSKKMDDLKLEQTVALDDKLKQFSIDQNANNKLLVVSLLQYAETKRRNDLLQMASWFSKQSELNNEQQRQIVNWVVNEQSQDEEKFNTLWDTINVSQK